MSRLIVCTPKSLPATALPGAARHSREINPANALERRTVARTPIGRVGGRKRLVVVTGRRWPASGVRLTVTFLDNPPADLRKRILSHMNAWAKSANVVFTETRGTGKVRIARLDSPVDMAGYWSYIGTEILEAPDDEPTLNLEGFTMRVSEREFRRVVRHEAGHTLGFDHEHMRRALVKKINRAKAIAFYDRTQGWSEEEERQADSGRHRHQPERLQVCRVDLSQESEIAGRPAPCRHVPHIVDATGSQRWVPLLCQVHFL